MAKQDLGEGIWGVWGRVSLRRISKRKKDTCQLGMWSMGDRVAEMVQKRERERERGMGREYVRKEEGSRRQDSTKKVV